MSEIKWDVFISHASEDKMEVAYPLSELLVSSGFKVWLDEAEIFIGDSLRAKIDAGLSHSQFGVIILSHNFFLKDWPKSELDGLLSKEIGGQKVILPVWHKITYKEIMQYSPILAGRMATNTEFGLDQVKEKLVMAMDRMGKKRPNSKPIYGGRLTKKEFLGFPDGSYLLSNTYSIFDRNPLIDIKINTHALGDQWEEIKKAGAEGRTCYLFKDHDDYQHYKQQLNTWRGLQRLRNRKK
jgi:hypothetical protein